MRKVCVGVKNAYCTWYFVTLTSMNVEANLVYEDMLLAAPTTIKATHTPMLDPSLKSPISQQYTIDSQRMYV